MKLQKMHGITGVGRLAAFLVSCIYVSAFGGIVPFVLDPTRDTKCEIVLPDEAIPAERTAANLLGRHLPKMLPDIEFPIVAESVAKTAKRIYVGSTKALVASGFNVVGWDAEEELVAARRKGLFVAGGRLRKCIPINIFLSPVISGVCFRAGRKRRG